MTHKLGFTAGFAALALGVSLSVPGAAWAEATGATPTGAPPPEAKAAVEGPKGPAEAPKIEAKADGTTATLSAGGLLTTGNSRLMAASGSGVVESRAEKNSVGAAVLGNYGRGAPPGKDIDTTTQNVQGRLRYDRYLIDQASLFLILTGRHDRFQGIDFRFNADPGFKYLFVNEAARALWAEGGYDFQYTIRREDARPELDAAGKPVLDSAGKPVLLDKTATDHSARLFLGFRYAFNKEVTWGAGLEYLQSVVDTKRYRVNFDTVFAAKVGGGLSIGFGFGARYDAVPLPGKEKLDTQTTLNLIYALSTIPEPPPPKTCPCPEPAPPEPPKPAAEPKPAPPKDVPTETKPPAEAPKPADPAPPNP